jgi:hypothetical protein
VIEQLRFGLVVSGGKDLSVEPLYVNQKARDKPDYEFVSREPLPVASQSHRESRKRKTETKNRKGQAPRDACPGETPFVGKT